MNAKHLEKRISKAVMFCNLIVGWLYKSIHMLKFIGLCTLESQLPCMTVYKIKSVTPRSGVETVVMLEPHTKSSSIWRTAALVGKWDVFEELERHLYILIWSSKLFTGKMGTISVTVFFLLFSYKWKHWGFEPRITSSDWVPSTCQATGCSLHKSYLTYFSHMYGGMSSHSSFTD